MSEILTRKVFSDLKLIFRGHRATAWSLFESDESRYDRECIQASLSEDLMHRVDFPPLFTRESTFFYFMFVFMNTEAILKMDLL